MEKPNQKFSVKKRAKSFSHALNGLKILFSEEHNSRIHLVISLFVIVAAYYSDVLALEWVALILCIGFVFVLEIINSAIENLSDYVQPEKHEAIKKTKDLAAAAVLVGSIVSAIVGLLIFLPKAISVMTWLQFQ